MLCIHWFDLIVALNNNTSKMANPWQVNQTRTLKLHARYTVRLSRLIDGFGDNLSAARVARYSIELLLSEEEEYRTGHYEGVWKRRFWFESFKNVENVRLGAQHLTSSLSFRSCVFKLWA